MISDKLLRVLETVLNYTDSELDSCIGSPQSLGDSENPVMCYLDTDAKYFGALSLFDTNDEINIGMNNIYLNSNRIYDKNRPPMTEDTYFQESLVSREPMIEFSLYLRIIAMQKRLLSRYGE